MRGSERGEFAELQQETDEIGITEVLNDPEYLEFLESYGEFEMPDDEMALEELIDLEADEPESGSASSKRSSDQPRHTEDARTEAVDDLIRTLESDAVSEAQRVALRNALGLQERKCMEVQFNHLKSRFLDLEAYLQAMEAFFEADTNPIEEIEDIRTEFLTIQNEIETLTEQVDATEEEIATITSCQTEHEEELASLDQSIEQTRTTLRQNLSVIETELKRNNRWRKRVTDAFRDVGSEHEDTDPAETHATHE